MSLNLDSPDTTKVSVVNPPVIPTAPTIVNAPVKVKGTLNSAVPALASITKASVTAPVSTLKSSVARLPQSSFTTNQEAMIDCPVSVHQKVPCDTQFIISVIFIC